MKCYGCPYYIFSSTLGSEEPIYHCRFGFSYFKGYLKTFEPPIFYDCCVEAKKIAINLPIVELNLF